VSLSDRCIDLMSKEDKSFIESWLRDCTGRSALLILTPTGSGISTWLFERAFPTHGMESVTINPHTTKIKTQIHDAYTSTITPLGGRKVLVLQAFDVLVNDSTMLTDATSKLKDPGVPTVCIGHVSRTVEKKFGNMFKVWERRVIHVMPKVEDIMDMLQATCDTSDIERAKDVSVQCRGDVRQAILRTEYQEFQSKDDFYEAEQVLTMLRQGTLTTTNDIHRAARGDRHVLSLAIFETYDPLQCPGVCDMYSFLDSVPREVQETMDWYDYLTVTYPAFHLRERKPQKNKKFSYGMVWSKTHLLANRYKQAKHSSMEFFERGMWPVNQFIMDEYPFFRDMMLAFVEADGRIPVPRWVIRQMDAKSILKVMRLWKTPWYNHGKTMKRIHHSWSTNESSE
jgi:hypothetical protein